MKTISSVSKFTAGTVLGALLLSGSAFAEMMVDDELAAKVEQEIMLMPTYSQGNSPSTISVKAEDGRLVLVGMVDSLEQRNEIQDLLSNMEGIDMDRVDNNLVMQ